MNDYQCFKELEQETEYYKAKFPLKERLLKVFTSFIAFYPAEVHINETYLRDKLNELETLCNACCEIFDLKNPGSYFGIGHNRNNAITEIVDGNLQTWFINSSLHDLENQEGLESIRGNIHYILPYIVRAIKAIHGT